MSDYTGERYYQVTPEAKLQRVAILTARLADLACMAEATTFERTQLEDEIMPQERLF